MILRLMPHRWADLISAPLRCQEGGLPANRLSSTFRPNLFQFYEDVVVPADMELHEFSGEKQPQPKQIMVEIGPSAG